LCKEIIMRVPISWLKDYVEIAIPLEELAERMTMAGLEVAAIEYVGAEWDRDKVFVGEILEVRPHPNADRLTIAVVEYGASQPMAVVTGAPNIRVGEKGHKVPFATTGARLIDGHSEELKYVTLKRTKIRGVASEGMVCSEKELGISDAHEGIMILDANAPTGMPLREYMGDAVLDLDLTPNLARCFSVVGVAREVAALTGQECNFGELPKLAETVGAEAMPWVEIEIADPDLCPRYTVALVRGVTTRPSPAWMQQRLTMAGMRPISNLVDVTNYVMLEWGQPLHAFDYDILHGRDGGTPPSTVPLIIVRRAHPGERMTTLDGADRALNEDTLLITDGGGPVGIAGVMGGLDSEVTEQTTNVLIEAATFNNYSIRRTSQALKLPSEASARFGRGVPPGLTIIAAERSARLMQELGGGTIEEGYADAYPAKSETKVLDLTAGEVERILGVTLETDQIVNILESLEFDCQVENEVIRATVPYYRLDVTVAADLIEDVARVWGYDRLPTTLMADDLPPQQRDHSLEGEERVRDVLVGCGLTEAITYSLSNLEAFAKLDPGGTQPDPEQYVRIANPLTSEREYMRHTLMSSLLEAVRDNLRYKERVALFEIGRVYLPEAGEELPREPRRLCVAMTGLREQRSWLTEGKGLFSFYDLKGVVETLLDHLGVDDRTFTPADHPTFRSGSAANLLLDGVQIGAFGEVDPVVRESFDLPAQPVCLLELDLEELLARVEPVRHLQPLPRYPSVSQDLSVIVDEGVSAERVEELIQEAGRGLLVGLTLFDVYRGEQVPEGKKSLAYSLTYRHEQRTLTDKEVAKVHARIVKRLEKDLAAKLRE
jgi:phenylalanyl-tRNA synthetase beta chain